MGARLMAFFLLVSLSQNMFAHSVGQLQTTKYFAPETVQMLLTRAATGTAGFQVGDTVSYIVQFTPVGNSSTTGVAGYVTDYIPPGTQVIGASIVTPVGATYVDVAPDLPAAIDNGWGTSTAGGARPQDTFGAPFNAAGYDRSGRCAARGLTNNCNGSLAQLYADTGIFFSTDPRTAAFPAAPARIQQAVNGYVVNPGGAVQLNPLLNQAVATTHNLWDAQQTNAFGTGTSTGTGAGVPALPSIGPNANGSQGVISFNNIGIGSTPYGAGSPVAGPQTGFPLDATGNTGPWQRISYAGSRVGTMATDPANAVQSTFNEPLADGVAIKGAPTGLGWRLSTLNPLPANTNAVRWAIGRLVVGQNKYVKISLRITAPVPAGGIINGSEVFGGDSGDGDDGADNPWRYHVPSVADNNSNLFVRKDVIGVNCALPTGTVPSLDSTCTPSDGVNIPANASVRYRITYLNSGNATQNNVVLSDILPFQAAAAGPPAIVAVSSSVVPNSFTVISGQNILPTSPAAPAANSTFSFKPITTLGGGEGGSVKFDVQLTAAAGALVGNKATLTSAGIPLGVSSNMVSAVINTPLLTVGKTTSTPAVSPGGTATYTITVTNGGGAAATNIILTDFLPFIGTTVDTTRRFSFAANGAAAVNGVAFTPPAPTVGTPTLAPYAPVAPATTNQQQVQWSLGAGVTLPAGQSLTLTFTAAVGANMPASAAAYTNDVRAAAGTINASGSALAPVVVANPLQVTKTIDCVYNTAGTQCNAYTGSGSIPANAKVRYRLNYTNSGSTSNTNVFLCDQLPTQVAGIGAVSTPAIAPIPAGPFTDVPPVGVRTSPANAACGYAGGNNFSYNVGTLLAGASGVAFFDAQTSGVTSIATITNQGKIVSTQSPSGSISDVTVSAVPPPIVSISKTTSTPAINLNGTATYTITVTNNGTSPINTIRVYDFLPFTGAVATSRFNFTGTPVISGMTSVAAATAVPPVIAPYSANTTQQQVLWDFGAQTLAAGASFTITFQAQAGTTMPASAAAYTNNMAVTYNVGATSFTQNGSSSAPVTINPNLTLTKSIVCVYVSATTCNAYVAGATLPVNAKVRYQLAYQNTGAIAQTAVVLSDTLPAQTAATSVSNVAAVSGPIAVTTTPALASITAGGTFSFPSTTVNAGVSGAITFDVQTTGTNGAVVTNNAKIVSALAPEGLTASASATVAAGTPNLTVTKTVVGSPNILPGGAITYRLTITNTGAATADTIKVYDFLPTSGGTTDNALTRLGFGGSSVFGGTIAAVTPTLTVPPTITPFSSANNQQQMLWDFGTPGQTLAPGASFTIDFTANAGASMPSGTYNNVARVSFDSPTGGGANNSALVPMQIVAPNLALTKTHSGNFTVGGTFPYTLIVNNLLGTAPTVGTITVTDTLPNGLTYVPAGSGGTGWSCAAVGQVVTCTSTAAFPAIAAGAAASGNPITLNVLAGTAAAPSVTNSATVSGGGEPAANNGDNSVIDATVVNVVPSTTFITDGMQSASPGSTVNYTHVFTAGVAGSVTFTSANVPNPSISGWANVIYRDTNCNGVLDAGEGAAQLSGAIAVAAGAQVCIIVKEFVPAGAPIGAQDQITVTATFTPTVGVPVVLTHTDLTTAMLTAGLGLIKEVRNVTTAGAFGSNNAALPGQVLEYRITYTNPGSSALLSVVINDATPAFTTFLIAACGPNVPNIICSVTTQPGAGGTGSLVWTLGGTLAPGSQSTVTYQVTVQP
jgi:uncharacterized repeat protein (TIGR01451 family)